MSRIGAGNTHHGQAPGACGVLSIETPRQRRIPSEIATVRRPVRARMLVRSRNLRLLSLIPTFKARSAKGRTTTDRFHRKNHVLPTLCERKRKTRALGAEPAKTTIKPPIGGYFTTVSDLRMPGEHEWAGSAWRTRTTARRRELLECYLEKHRASDGFCAKLRPCNRPCERRCWRIFLMCERRTDAQSEEKQKYVAA